MRDILKADETRMAMLLSRPCTEHVAATSSTPFSIPILAAVSQLPRSSSLNGAGRSKCARRERRVTSPQLLRLNAMVSKMTGSWSLSLFPTCLGTVTPHSRDLTTSMTLTKRWRIMFFERAKELLLNSSHGLADSPRRTCTPRIDTPMGGKRSIIECLLSKGLARFPVFALFLSLHHHRRYDWGFGSGPVRSFVSFVTITHANLGGFLSARNNVCFFLVTTTAVYLACNSTFLPARGQQDMLFRPNGTVSNHVCRTS